MSWVALDKYFKNEVEVDKIVKSNIVGKNWILMFWIYDERKKTIYMITTGDWSEFFFNKNGRHDGLVGKKCGVNCSEK